MVAHNVTLPESTQLTIIKAAAARHGIDWRTLLGVYGTETGYGTNVTTSSAGAQGPFQFEPATARKYGLANPWDFASSAEAAARYLKDLGADGDIGSGATAKALNSYSGGGGNDYVAKVRTLGQGLHKAIDPNDPTDVVGKAYGAVKDALSVPEKFYKLVTDPQTWLRLVEIVLGVALLLMGLKSFTGGAIDPVGAATRVAGRVA